jgi:dihydroxy-acid dehydratase
VSLRSNFSYGSSAWATRRAQWRALGISDADMEKPKVAVVNSSSELAICFSHLDGVARVVKEAVRAAGGLPFEIRTTAPSDFIFSPGGRGGYILASRDLVAADIEVQVEGPQLDGMICLTSCDKTVPGQLMAAARTNIPTIFVICGYQPSGELDGHHVDIEDVFLTAGHVLTGKTSAEALRDMSEVAVRGPGVCSGMGTANSMHTACEALGMALPGAAPVLANSEKMFQFAKRSGERIVAMIEEDLRPRAILKAGAIENALRAVLAVSGSINCIKHLQAVAIDAGLDLDIYGMFDHVSDETPVLSAVRPNGEASIEAFEAAGGARAVMKQLQPMLDTSAMTVTGRTVGENLSDAQVLDADVIRPLDNPYSSSPPIVIVRGSLAPHGGVIKLGLREGRSLTFEGPAIVFENAEDAMTALQAGRVEPGHVLVLRGLGPRATPGMGGASRVVFAVDGADLGPKIAIVTDGQLSGLVNKGLVVGEVSPEAALGPLGLVKDGDVIAIDADKRTIELQVTDDELKDRHERIGDTRFAPLNGWLGIYRDNVQPLIRGGVVGRRP